MTNTSGTTGVPAKAVSYNKYGNILTKDGRTYTYGNTAKPHQLTQITGSIHGAGNPTYSYDANGNMLTGGGATVSWMSFNMVNTMSQGSQSSSFLYGPEHQRVKQTAAYNGQNITTWYLDNFELEKNTTSNTTQAKHYIAGKVLHIETGTAATPASVQTKYLHKDHLGSIALITDSTGAAVERYSYDAWGKRRNLNGTDYTANGGHLLGTTDRGYTGHEHLDHLGLVHMNGRIYDASLGRFMSADPFIAQTTNLQNYNRYAYVNNNPLSYTDPSGYFLKKLFKNKVFRTLVTIAAAYYTGGLVEGWLLQSGNAAFATTAGLTAAGKVAVGVASGFASGFVGSGGDLKSAFHAGLTGAAFAYAGTVGTASNSIERYFAHAAAGCLSSALGGADCDQGAVSALAGKYVNNNTPLSWGGSTGLAAATVAGGTVSILSGGKFTNGAVTAAFGYLYNNALVAGSAASRAGIAACGSSCRALTADHEANAAKGLTGLWNDFKDGVRGLYDGLIYAKPPAEAYYPDGPKAPGKPGADEGFTGPKGGDDWVKNPNGRGYGWRDKSGDVWVPTGPYDPSKGDSHGGSHWDVQTPGGGYVNVYPGGARRP